MSVQEELASWEDSATPPNNNTPTVGRVTKPTRTLTNTNHRKQKTMQTETNAATATNAVTIPTTAPHLTHMERGPLLPGNHPATITGAKMARNRNGKLHVELDCDLGNRRIQHQMFCTSEAGTANTARQLKNAFGVSSFKELDSIVGQSCSLRIEDEEYNGRTSAKVRYVNPHSTEEAGDLDLAALDAGFAATEAPDIAF